MKVQSRRGVVGVVGLLMAAAVAGAQEGGAANPIREIPEMDVRSFPDVAGKHPAGKELLAYFGDAPKAAPASFKSTGMTRKDYLPLIAGNVDFWKHFVNADGAVIDPYEKRERQYSTPAFAMAAALLMKESDRKDLADVQARAMTWALERLAAAKAADGHGDFYIPLLVHARRLMADVAPKAQLAKWDEVFKSLEPEKIYRDRTGGGNWNLVNVSGEALRRKDGLVPADKMDAHWAYIERCMARQQRLFTKFGMYEDPNSPLAYDAFPRLWLEDMMADGAYAEGKLASKVERFLLLGGFSSMLLTSPSGEWASGGRSAHHQWNEAENAEIAEINAVKWAKAGRPDVAGAYKRLAHLALQSMKRWQRPSGEMWIVKNFADPARRFGFEGYSFNSQYNLLPMGMLAIAYVRADDAIEEFPLPCEAGGYVYDVREVFHHVVAAAGGTYVLIDTGADPGYGSTGLQRVHKSGVALSPLTDTPARDRHMGPADEPVKRAMAVGIEWKVGEEWRSHAAYGVRPKQPSGPDDKPVPAERDIYTKNVELKVTEQSPGRVAFTIRYELGGQGARTVEEDYVVTPAGVEGATRVVGEGGGPMRAVFPALVHDGARDTEVSIDGGAVRVSRRGAPWYNAPGKGEERREGGVVTWAVTEPAGVKLGRTGPLVATHNGYVQAVAGELPSGVQEIKWRIVVEGETAGEGGAGH